MKIEVYSDGSATVSTKPGGYGWVLCVEGNRQNEGSGHMEKATNNDAELMAAIKGLEAALAFVMSDPSSFPQEHEVTLKSDSELILGWANGTYRFKQEEKMFAYDRLRDLMRKLRAKTEWVKGHSGDQWNERCDFLANQARLGLQKEQDKEEAKITGASLIGTKKESVFCVWFDGKLKVLDFSQNVCEDYDRKVHGKRGSSLEIRKDKMR